jgi:uncharacterized protein YcfJ
MKKLFCYGLMFVASTAVAEVTLVADPTNTQDEYAAKVLSKTLILDHVPRLASRKVCDKVVERIHIDKHENIIRVTPNNMIRCRVQTDEEIIQVVRGYQVTYEYKGKIVSTNLNYDPGEFIKLKD